MPVVPITQRREDQLPESIRPDDVHLAMAASELYDLLSKTPMNPPKPKPKETEAPLEPGEKFNKLKGFEKQMEEEQPIQDKKYNENLPRRYRGPQGI